MLINDIDRLVEKAQQPFDNPWLDYMMSQVDAKERAVYYRFLYWLVLECKPSVTLELGVEFGMASAYMAEAAKTYGGKVVGIDLNWHNIPGTQIAQRCGNYDYITGDTLASFPYIYNTYGKLQIGVVFQDSSHHFNASIVEWDLYTKLLSKNAVWVCDDIARWFHDPLVDPPGKSMLEYFQSRPGEKKLYPELYAKGVANAVGIILT